MDKYASKNDEGVYVLDYDLLDMAQRINFMNDVHNWAKSIEVDLESEPDASNAERLEAIDNQADMTVKATFTYLYRDGEEIEVDDETQQMVIDAIASDLCERYGVQS